MSQDNVPNKTVHLYYLCAGILLFFVLKWTIDWLWGYVTKVPDEFYVTVGAAVLALVSSIWAYRNERTYTLAVEVAAELSKVTWPTAKDTRTATIVVIVMTIISAIILGFFDLMWSNFTMLIYG